MKSLIFFIALVLCLPIQAKDKPQYAVNKIDLEVQLSEQSVIRNHKTSIHLTEKSAILKEQKVVTLLNSNHFDRFDYMVAGYSSLEKINVFEVNIFDKNGKELKSYKQKDIQDIAASDSGMVNDERLKYVEINEYAYPFTIEFVYEKKVKDTYLLLPRWELSEHPASYTEKSSLTIYKPSSINYTIDYRLHNYQLDTKKITPEQIKFEAKNIASFGPEDFGPKHRYQKPHIILSSHYFDIDGYTGSFENWNSLGEFYYDLNKSQFELDEEFIAPLTALITDTDSDRKKAEIIYQYMQNKTRYVSVQLGIGGWQSFPASYVEKNAYGDCKALTTYTKTLLDHFNINSYPVLINAGDEENDLSYDFKETAYNGFNHVILAIPSETDTLWMECTSQIQPFNFLGTFTMDRKGLMIKPNGESELVQTPKTDPEKDRTTNQYTIFLNEDGSASINLDIHAMGISAEHIFSAHSYLSGEEFKERLPDILDIPNSNATEYSFETVGENMEIKLSARFEAKNIASKTGSRIFLEPLQYQSKRAVPRNIEDRVHDFVLPFSFSNHTTVRIVLPDGYAVENAETDPIQLEALFGNYNTSMELKESEIIVSSVFTRNSGIYKPDVAKEYATFSEQVNEAKNRMIVLKKEISH